MACLTLQANGQIVRDGTLGSGPTGQLAGGPHFNIPASMGELICNLQRNPCNLFHSFSQFNINTGQSVTFHGPTGFPPARIANVLARVTDMASTIDGPLRTAGLGAANFFLINPHGVMFGPNAQLDVGGSFLVTTANDVFLDGNGRFAVDPDSQEQLLTTASPAAFGFLDAVQGDVQVNGSTLHVPPGRSLSVIGDDVTIADGDLAAPGGQLNMVSVAGTGRVALDGTNANSAVELSGFDQQGALRVTQASVLSVDGASPGGAGGRLVIRGGSLTLDNAQLTNRTSGAGSGGAVDIAITGEMILSNAATVTVETSGSGDAASMAVSADRLTLSESGSGATGLFSTVHSVASGNGGDIDVSVNHLSLAGDAAIESTTSGTGGEGGSIRIGGRDQPAATSVVLGSPDRFSGPRIASSATAQSNGSGGGDVVIDAESLSLFRGAQITSASSDLGVGGDILITANDLLLDGRGERQTRILAESVGREFATGGGIGEVNIAALRLRLLDGAEILSNTTQLSDAGRIEINAQEIDLDGADTRIAVADRSTGLFRLQTVGQIMITSPTVRVTNGAQIAARTSNRNPSGTIRILASDSLLVDGVGSAVIAAPLPGPRGNGGNIFIGDTTNPSGSLEVRNGAAVSVETGGLGDGGTITIGVDSITLSDGGRITSTSNNTGNAGRIDLVVGDSIHLFNGSSIETAALANQATGGDILIRFGSLNTPPGTVQTGSALTLENSQISARASGTGGNVSLFGPARFELTNSQITAAAGNDGGSIAVRSGRLALNDSSIEAGSLTGNGGDISLLAEGDLALGSSGVFAEAALEGGDILLQAGQKLSLLNSEVSAEAIEAGGDVSLVAGAGLLLEDSIVSALARDDGGDIGLTAAGGLAVQDSLISARALGAGGDIALSAAAGTVELNGSLVTAVADGSGGVIAVSGANVLMDRSTISASSLTGSGGGISLLATRDMVVRSNSNILAEATTEGGDILLSAGTTLDIDASTLSASSLNTGGNIDLIATQHVWLVGTTVRGLAGGDGGRIAIDPVFVILDRTLIDGRSGGAPTLVSIDPNAIFLSSASVILTGAIESPPELDLTASLIAPTASVVDIQAQLQPHCAAQMSGQPSSFTVLGRGGVPVTPGRWQPSIDLVKPTQLH